MPRSHALLVLPFWASIASAAITSSENNSTINIANDRLSFSVAKSSGSISKLSLDGQNLLGTGRGPYLDVQWDGFWAPGSGAEYELFTGTDVTKKSYAGAMMSQNKDGKILEQYWFLRDGETGLHVFSRAKYSNTTAPSGGDLGEMRQLFRPTASIWTHISSSDDMFAPLPDTTGAPVVQDATWYLDCSISGGWIAKTSHGP
jgi:rhamnogalacturonan endolyase